MELEFILLALPLKTDTEKALENLQTELINLQCDTNLMKNNKRKCKY
jgi:hypothetical protein